MKLLNTINTLIQEAENNLYDASLNSTSIEEIEFLETKLEESLDLLKLYEGLF